MQRMAGAKKAKRVMVCCARSSNTKQRSGSLEGARLVEQAELQDGLVVEQDAQGAVGVGAPERNLAHACVALHLVQDCAWGEPRLWDMKHF